MRTLQFKSVDRVPCMEIALWQQTWDRWVSEGMPSHVAGDLMRGSEHFRLEGYDTLNIDATGPRPPVPYEVLEETDEHVLFVDGFGRKRMALKTGTVRGQRMSMDRYIEFAVRDRASFQRFKEHYTGPTAERYPADWKATAARLRASDKPLTLLDPLSGTFGYYSMLRNWMGTEGVSYLLYDDTALVEECLEFLTEFAIRTLTPAVEEVKFDFYYIHEDMCYKNGPLVSPQMFRRLFLPHYLRFIGFLRSHGVELIMVDTDGNHEVLTPVFLDAGVDGFGPIERAADMDPVKVRREYGRRVAMVGGVDKREIAKGRRAIEREIQRSIVPILDQGGYIPVIDHAIPPDVSLADFEYYLELKRKALAGESN
jgi:uroporphyrinogen decarboxylase